MFNYIVCEKAKSTVVISNGKEAKDINELIEQIKCGDAKILATKNLTGNGTTAWLDVNKVAIGKKVGGMMNGNMIWFKNVDSFPIFSSRKPGEKVNNTEFIKRRIVLCNDKLYCVVFNNGLFDRKHVPSSSETMKCLNNGTAYIAGVRRTGRDKKKGSWLLIPTLEVVSTQNDKRFNFLKIDYIKINGKFQEFVDDAFCSAGDRIAKAIENSKEILQNTPDNIKDLSQEEIIQKYGIKEEKKTYDASTVLSLIDEAVFDKSVSDAEFRGMYKLYVTIK